ncbi:Crp/Fnr family transcriptional regulator [Desulfovibrio sp. JC022]|uniref:Crp/Fnr family transcriptional regulator n=1 Tax=Desulfovibrio sp. JC022 TaxID=2593642 RepID=UPI0013D1DD38|nr:Crp/Fnr family transcriptional regulator [Desulfovibrio sp. JC022]NDV24451.1 Crp/Fnr family transcriptional regulator [Desulfovibrio sp. JC022]
MTRKQIEKEISELALFTKLKKEQLERLSGHAVINEIPKKSVFFSEDKTSKGLHILLTGKVKLFKISDEGKEQTIFVFGPGEPFCLCSVFSDGVLPANMSALEDSRVLFINPAEYEKLVQEDPTILMQMMRVMSRRLKDAMEMIDSLALKQVPSRLAAYFLSREISGLVNMDISYRELSKIIGITPEALSRTMKKMSAGGLIDVNGTEIKIHDREELSRCSDGGCLR